MDISPISYMEKTQKIISDPSQGLACPSPEPAFTTAEFLSQQQSAPHIGPIFPWRLWWCSLLSFVVLRRSAVFTKHPSLPNESFLIFTLLICSAFSCTAHFWSQSLTFFLGLVSQAGFPAKSLLAFLIPFHVAFPVFLGIPAQLVQLSLHTSPFSPILLSLACSTVSHGQ